MVINHLQTGMILQVGFWIKNPSTKDPPCGGNILPTHWIQVIVGIMEPHGPTEMGHKQCSSGRTPWLINKWR